VISCEAAPDRADAGINTFRHYGINHRDELVCEIERSPLIARRPGALS